MNIYLYVYTYVCIRVTKNHKRHRPQRKRTRELDHNEKMHTWIDLGTWTTLDRFETDLDGILEPSWSQVSFKIGPRKTKSGPIWCQVGAKLEPKIEQNRSQEQSKMRSFIKNATKIHPNRSQGLLGDVWMPSSGSSIDFGTILVGFGTQVGAKLALKSVQEGPSWGQEGPEFGQVGAKFGQLGF